MAIRTKLCLTLAIALTTSALAQSHPWQSLQMPTASEVLARWVSPPSEYGPEPYYGMNGPITLDVIRRDFDTMHAEGFRAVTIQYGSGSPMAYLSPEYFKFFREVVAEAKKRDMRLWIVDDAGYPSGFAGGKFTTDHPNLRMQALIATKVPIASGAAFDAPVSSDTVAITAIHKPDGETAQISIAAGHAHWTAPTEGWTVYIVDHAFRTSPTRSDTNPTRAKDTTQSLEDYLDPVATAQYLKDTHEAYKKWVGDEFGKTILGFRGDEPDYSINGLPWTPKFFAQFQQSKGYDIRPYTAIFLQSREAKLTSAQLRVRADFYDVFANLFRDGFFKPQADWCAANGLEYQTHLNHEEMEIPLAHSEGDFFRDMRFTQVPGIDSIWHQIWTDTISDFPRLASSAAHVYGHPRAFTESFAAYRPTPDITMARYILNEQFVRGINLVETMYFPATTQAGRAGPATFMRDPAYPALMEYTRRLSYLMSMGRPAAEVALLLPSESLWMGDTTTDDAFVTSERILSEHQIDFDIVDEDALGSILKLEPGAFLTQSGSRYRTILIPPTTLLRADVVDRLRAFAGKGGHVLFVGNTPTRIAAAADRDAREASPADFAWATTISVTLPPTPTPPAQPPVSAPAPITVPTEFISALHAAGPSSALTIENPDPALRMIHRQLKDATVFLLFNESATAIAHNATLHTAGKSAQTWDPQTGTAKDLPTKKGAGQLTFSLDLPPYTTQVLVVR